MYAWALTYIHTRNQHGEAKYKFPRFNPPILSRLMPSSFSRKTILELVKALNFKTYDDITRFCLEFGIEDEISGKYLKEKQTSISAYLIANPNKNGPNGAALQIEVIEHLANGYSGTEPFVQRFSDLLHSLERDGFELNDDGLRRILPDILPIAEQEDQILSLIDKFGFVVAKGHYEQAISAHARGEWAAANAQLRTFVEDVLGNIQNIVCQDESRTISDKLNALASSGFILNNYNEWFPNGTGFVQGFWKRLHPEGSHPGLSEQFDSTFRLHLVIIVMHHFLVRLQEYTENSGR